MGIIESKFIDNYFDIVRAEYLVSEITGSISEENYYGRSAQALDHFKITDPTGKEAFDSAHVMQLDESFRVCGYFLSENFI